MVDYERMIENVKKVKEGQNILHPEDDFIKAMHKIMRINRTSANIGAHIVMILFKTGVLTNKNIPKEYKRF
ncbi:hypothetical protein [Liquorilactobacillus uvarum]|uniref:Uncharacterized protein n=1 Tax=Liquorilactobacillus uvarum DSM 19971 TaxID=1423812 RepID=A0A0R1PVS8_9LACO|nr:hypothetical protein [Liquorilactobacillus uvarum]KRL36607.1 hypothetical protein FD20_GL001150 [Liquorilactobacillus uvarum DSM 19971]